MRKPFVVLVKHVTGFDVNRRAEIEGTGVELSAKRKTKRKMRENICC